MPTEHVAVLRIDRPDQRNALSTEVLQELATGRSNAATAKALYMSERAVEKHIGSVFQKLGLADESDVNRRVMAVLAFPQATGGPGPR